MKRANNMGKRAARLNLGHRTNRRNPCLAGGVQQSCRMRERIDATCDTVRNNKGGWMDVAKEPKECIIPHLYRQDGGMCARSIYIDLGDYGITGAMRNPFFILSQPHVHPVHTLLSSPPHRSISHFAPIRSTRPPRAPQTRRGHHRRLPLPPPRPYSLG